MSEGARERSRAMSRASPLLLEPNSQELGGSSSGHKRRLSFH